MMMIFLKKKWMMKIIIKLIELYHKTKNKRILI